MSKIIGDSNTIKIAKEAKPGDNTVLINWDAIADLPDEYEAIITEVKFNLGDDFSDVGNKTYMPSPALHYKIAEARGIHGGDSSIAQPIYEDVNVNEMNMIDTPFFTKMLVGYRSVKFSTVMEEDGTLRRSSACTIDYNVWNRCADVWASEELATEGYSALEDGFYSIKEWGKLVEKTGLHFTNKSGYITEPKYNTKWKRKNHFQTELKFAMQKAETKAHEKTIRELAGLQTGYKEDQLRAGRLIFAKIRRSRKILQAESAARLTALSKGLDIKVIEDTTTLFGDMPEPTIFKGEKPTVVYVLSPKEKLINTLTKYGEAKCIPDILIETADNIINWAEKLDNPEKDKFWTRAIGALKAIEEDVAPEFREQHDLY